MNCKHSVRVNGRATSISMEQSTFDALKQLARSRNQSVEKLAEHVRRDYPREKLSRELRRLVAASLKPAVDPVKETV